MKGFWKSMVNRRFRRFRLGEDLRMNFDRGAFLGEGKKGEGGRKKKAVFFLSRVTHRQPFSHNSPVTQSQRSSPHSTTLIAVFSVAASS